jgi:hypothetical protein
MLAASQDGQVYISQNVGAARGRPSGVLDTTAFRPVAVILNWTYRIAANAPHHPQFAVGTLMGEA